MTDEVRSVVKWGDSQQYLSAPIKKNEDSSDSSGITVALLSATDDPLGAIAAACRMYKGIPTYSLSDINDIERYDYLKQVMKTNLKAPFEFVDFHFFIEGVDRSFTHQMVRQRTAVFAQESLRFAVKESFSDEVVPPPSVAGLAADHPWRVIWNNTLNSVQDGYEQLVNGGMPAEEARGLLPHCVPTRLNYHTNLRNLQEHLGNRLCTQAQHHWKIVAAKMVQAIRKHSNDYAVLAADAFKPVCYLTGKCEFNAEFDRHCSIRERVNKHHQSGEPSTSWSDIHPSEWLENPGAARL